jgi:Arc/MetJ-type ribon-helix-helix transcriptional regulator
MDVRLDPQSQRLVEQQLRAGRYQSPEEVVARALETLAEREPPRSEADERRRAVQAMLEFAGKHRFTLGEDLRLRDLIHEGHMDPFVVDASLTLS